MLDVLQEYTERTRAESFAKIHGWQCQQLHTEANRLSERTGEAPQSVYARFFRRFSVRQTADLSRSRFAEALAFLQQPAPPACYHPQLTQEDVFYLEQQGQSDTRLLNIALKNLHLVIAHPEIPQEV